MWKRHRRHAGDGTWGRVFTRVPAESDGAGKIDRAVSVDATIGRAIGPSTKQWRGLATRYDKLAITYRAALALCAILTWLRT